MDPAKGIGKLGFRRWYERELFEAFAYLVTCLLCMVLLAVAFEQQSLISLRVETLLVLGFGFAAFTLGLHSLRRFVGILQRAQEYSRAASCTACASFGRFDVTGSGTTAADSPGAERVPWIRVKCRNCGSVWTID